MLGLGSGFLDSAWTGQGTDNYTLNSPPSAELMARYWLLHSFKSIPLICQALGETFQRGTQIRRLAEGFSPQHLGIWGWMILCGGTGLCVAGPSAASLASTHFTRFPVVTAKTGPHRCQRHLQAVRVTAVEPMTTSIPGVEGESLAQ